MAGQQRGARRLESGRYPGTASAPAAPRGSARRHREKASGTTIRVQTAGRHGKLFQRRVEQRRCREVGTVIGEADEMSVPVLEALGEQRPERQADHQQQQQPTRTATPARHQEVVRRQHLTFVAGEARDSRREHSDPIRRPRRPSSLRPGSTPRSRIRLEEKKSAVNDTSPPLSVARQKRTDEIELSHFERKTRLADVGAQVHARAHPPGRMQSRTAVPTARPSCGRTGQRQATDLHALGCLGACRQGSSSSPRKSATKAVLGFFGRSPWGRADLLDGRPWFITPRCGRPMGERLFLIVRHHDGRDSQSAFAAP